MTAELTSDRLPKWWNHFATDGVSSVTIENLLLKGNGWVVIGS